MSGLQRFWQRRSGGEQLLLGGVAVLAVLLVLSAAFGYSSGSGSSTRPGSASVYSDIAASSDCTWLQAQFDRADENNQTASSGYERDYTLGYMQAADKRMREVGCYG